MRASTGAMAAAAAAAAAVGLLRRPQRAPAPAHQLPLVLLRVFEAHENLDSMIDARQLVSGLQARLTHCSCGQSLPKGSGPLSMLASMCCCTLALVCSVYRTLQRTRMLFLEGHPRITRGGDTLVLVIFAGQRPQGWWYNTYPR